MLRTTMHGLWRGGMAAAVVMASGALWLAPAPVAGLSTAAAMCPPSEGELDLEAYDLSGDGVVQLPEGVRWRVMPTRAGAADEGACGTKTRASGVTLVLEDPAGDGRRVMTMKLTTLAATEVQEWLSDAVSTQQAFLAAKSYNEKPGMECAVDVQHCRAAAGVKAAEGGGCPHAAKTAVVKKIEMPRMYVSVASAQGQHGWSMLPASRRAAAAAQPEAPAEAEGCWQKKPSCGGGEVEKKSTTETVAAGVGGAVGGPADHRITLTAYQMRDQANQPLSVRMDVKTAERLAADLKDALAGKQPKVAEPAVEKPDQQAGKGVS